MIDLRDLEALLDNKDRFLTQTTNLENSDQEELHPIWNNLHYPSLKRTSSKLLGTVLNSILTQRRGVFILTRDDLKETYKSDPNHIWGKKGPTAFGNDETYPQMRKMLRFDLKIAKLIQAGEGKKGDVFEIIDEDILAYLRDSEVDIDAQRLDCLAYVRGDYSSRMDRYYELANAVYMGEEEPVANPNELQTTSAPSMKEAITVLAQKPAAFIEPKTEILTPAPEKLAVVKKEPAVPAVEKETVGIMSAQSTSEAVSATATPTEKPRIDIMASLKLAAKLAEPLPEPKNDTTADRMVSGCVAKLLKPTSALMVPDKSVDVYGMRKKWTEELETFAVRAYPNSPHAQRWAASLAKRCLDATNSYSSYEDNVGEMQDWHRTQWESRSREVRVLLAKGPDKAYEEWMEKQAPMQKQTAFSPENAGAFGANVALLEASGEIFV